LRAAWDAFNRGDVEAVLSYIDPVRRRMLCIALIAVALVALVAAPAMAVRPRAGRLAGQTSEGLPFTLIVAHNRRTLGVRLRWGSTCSGDRHLGLRSVPFPTRSPQALTVGRGGAFSRTFNSRRNFGGGVTETSRFTVRGRFTSARVAAGTVSASIHVANDVGDDYTCTPTLPWRVPRFHQSFAPAPSSPVASSAGWASLLSDGKVLVVGAGGASAVFDPVVNAWRAAASQPAPRAIAPTLLHDGRVLFEGGGTGGVYPNVAQATAQIYDPAADRWSSAASLATPRYGHTATLLSDGRVLVAGGTGNAYTKLSSVEIYDPAANTWTAGPPLAHSHDLATATRLRDGHVLLAAGGDEHNGATNAAELFDPAAGGSWSPAAPLHDARAWYSALLLPSGKVLAIGGDGVAGRGFGPIARAEIYDPATNVWTPTANPGGPHSGRHVGALLADGRALVVDRVGLGSLANAELYDVGRNRWSAATLLPDPPRYTPLPVTLADGRVLILGVAGGGAAFFDPRR
jgi:hypothetical protein